MPNLVQQQEIVQMLSDQQLQTELQQPTGSVPGFLLASEAMRRQSLKQQMASAQAPQETTVVDDLASQMGPQNPPMMRTGGMVRGFDSGGPVWERYGRIGPQTSPMDLAIAGDMWNKYSAKDSGISDLQEAIETPPPKNKFRYNYGLGTAPGSKEDFSQPAPEDDSSAAPIESISPLDPILPRRGADSPMSDDRAAYAGEDAALRAKQAESAKTEASMDPEKLRNDRYAKYEQAIKDMYAKAEGDNNMFGYSAGEMAGFAGEMFKPRSAGESNQMYRIAQGLQALNAGYDERQKANKELELRKDAGLLALMQAKDSEPAAAASAEQNRQAEVYKTLISNGGSEIKMMLSDYQKAQAALDEITANAMGSPEAEAVIQQKKAELVELKKQIMERSNWFKTMMDRYAGSANIDTSMSPAFDGEKIVYPPGTQ
jgi:hypothetical protein